MARVALIGDERKWAYGFTIGSLRHYYRGEHDLSTGFVCDDHKDKLRELIRRTDLVVSFSPGVTEEVLRLGADMKHLLVALRSMLPASMPGPRLAPVTDNCLGVVSVNQRHAARWRGHTSKVYLAYEGADMRRFYPPLVYKVTEPPYVYGWAGKIDRQCKNYKTIYLPLMQQLGLDGIGVPLVANNDIPVRKMRVEFYWKLDYLLVTSWGDGNPLPIYEAMACGVPVISTSTGVAPEIIDDGADGYVVGRALFDNFIRVIRMEMQRADRLPEMRAAAVRKVLNGWTWEQQWHAWSRMFDDALGRI